MNRDIEYCKGVARRTKYLKTLPRELAIIFFNYKQYIFNRGIRVKWNLDYTGVDYSRPNMILTKNNSILILLETLSPNGKNIQFPNGECLYKGKYYNVFMGSLVEFSIVDNRIECRGIFVDLLKKVEVGSMTLFDFYSRNLNILDIYSSPEAFIKDIHIPRVFANTLELYNRPNNGFMNRYLRISKELVK